MNLPIYPYLMFWDVGLCQLSNENKFRCSPDKIPNILLREHSREGRLDETKSFIWKEKGEAQIVYLTVNYKNKLALCILKAHHPMKLIGIENKNNC